MKLIIMVGLPGSGKSTWINKFLKEANLDYFVVSRDAIRTMLYPERYFFSDKYEPYVSKITKKSIRLLAEADKNLIVDETNINKSARDKILTSCRFVNNNVEVLYVVFYLDPSICLDRRMNEPRGYPEHKWQDVITRMDTAFDPPADDGFNEMIKVYVGGEK